MNKFKVAKHFHIEITDNAFTFFRDEEKIAAEAALDGIYVLRTSLPAQTLHRDDVVLRYQGLEDVERFFRTLNTELDVRPIRHHLADRVRAHVFLRMLSYYLSWQMKQALARSCSTTTTNPPQPPNATTPSRRPNVHTPRWPKPRLSAPPTTTRYTASPACSPPWPPYAPTRFNPPPTYQRSRP